MYVPATKCGADMLRTNPLEESVRQHRFTAIYRQACPPRSRLRRRRLQLNRYPADLAVELEGTECGQATASPSLTRVSAPSASEKDIGLCPVTSAGADCSAATSPTASQVIVTSKNECGSFLNLANLFVHVNRHNHPQSMHSTRYFSWIRPRM